MEIDNQIFAAVEVARARQLAEARYSEQRRQALAAILYGVVIMVLVIAAAGWGCQLPDLLNVTITAQIRRSCRRGTRSAGW